MTDGSVLTVHCPNTGSMKNCLVPGTPCWYSLSDNPKRKLPGTLEIVTTASGALAGVNTGRPNALVEEAISSGLIAALSGYQELRREVKYGAENSRIDLLLSNPGERCYVEVKNVTLEADSDGTEQNRRLLFPDAVTTRGTKHLRELAAMVREGHRAVLFFCVQHSDADVVEPAWDIDPVYCETLIEVVGQGVEVIAYRCKIHPDEIVIDQPLPVRFRPSLSHGDTRS